MNSFLRAGKRAHLLALLICSVAGGAEHRQVAITIDDLPRGGDSAERGYAAVHAMTDRLLEPFRGANIPVIGFVNEGRPVEFGSGPLRELLELWLDAGADLGNHTFSHVNINRIDLETYARDIVKGEPMVRSALGARSRTLRYFRHPYLFTGPTAEVKSGLQAFLDKQGYIVAPVTIDNADYLYAAAYAMPAHRENVAREYVPYMESVVEFFEQRSVEVFGREIPQILLLHANQLNADQMPQLLAMFRRRGYHFVTLEQALADEAYRSEETYVGTNGISWLHRWSRSRGMKPRSEPEPADWVSRAVEGR